MIHQTWKDCKFFVVACPFFRQNFFPEHSIKIARRETFPSAPRIGASAAAAVVAAAVVVVAAAIVAAPAAAAEQDDDEDDDPQAAAAAPVVIAAPHYEYLLIMKVLRGLFAALDTIIWPGREIGAFRL